MRFSSGKYQLDPFIDGNGTQPLLPLLSRFFFMGAVRLTQETPTRGWATGFLQCTGWGAGHNRATSRLDGGALPMKIDVGTGDLMDSKFGEQGARAHRSGDSQTKGLGHLTARTPRPGGVFPPIDPARKHPGYNRRKIPSGEYRDPTLGKCRLSLEGSSEPQSPLRSSRSFGQRLRCSPLRTKASQSDRISSLENRLCTRCGPSSKMSSLW